MGSGFIREIPWDSKVLREIQVEAMTAVHTLTALETVFNDEVSEPLEGEKLTQRNLDKFFQLVLHLGKLC